MGGKPWAGNVKVATTTFGRTTTSNEKVYQGYIEYRNLYLLKLVLHAARYADNSRHVFVCAAL